MPSVGVLGIAAAPSPAARARRPVEESTRAAGEGRRRRGGTARTHADLFRRRAAED